MFYRILAAFLLLPVLANAQTVPTNYYVNLNLDGNGNTHIPAVALYCPTSLSSYVVGLCNFSGGGGGGGPLRTAPTGFSAALTTTPTQILAAGTYTRISFIAQGGGYCAYSFTSASPSVTTGGVSTNGYPLSNGSVFNTSSIAVPNTALYAVCAAGSSMTIYGDYQ